MAIQTNWMGENIFTKMHKGSVKRELKDCFYAVDPWQKGELDVFKKVRIVKCAITRLIIHGADCEAI